MSSLRLFVVAMSSSVARSSIALPGYKTTYELVAKGSGATVTKGAKVTVHATGWSHVENKADTAGHRGR